MLDLHKRYPDFIAPCLGVHPVQSLTPDRSATLQDLEGVEEFIRKNHEELVAIGEVGLDFTPRFIQKEEDKEIQREVFSKQIKLALELDLPLNVHSRSAGRHVIEMLQQHGKNFSEITQGHPTSKQFNRIFVWELNSSHLKRMDLLVNYLSVICRPVCLSVISHLLSHLSNLYFYLEFTLQALELEPQKNLTPNSSLKCPFQGNEISMKISSWDFNNILKNPLIQWQVFSWCLQETLNCILWFSYPAIVLYIAMFEFQTLLKNSLQTKNGRHFEVLIKVLRFKACREQVSDSVSSLWSSTNSTKNVLLHAFDGKPSNALKGVEAGYYFSIPPSIVRSPQKEKLVKNVPLSNLLLETDSPALAAEKQTRNEPKNIHISCEAIARIKGTSVQTVYDETTKNALKLFPKLHRFLRK
ncbi:unnamed protein product [Porites lobata]|uniref:Uncharacterized protein n=1 Tax=Porites lobata TaxID=104759 RepID=A0ABN8NJ67_9CNID|nr:unnamed protein product [Porites lobata]